jgi:hypothetical protein
MDEFLAILRDNLTRLNLKDNAGEARAAEPLLKAFGSTINMLAEEYGQAAADMAMTAIARGIEAGGASDANMTGVLSRVFSQIALDPTLKGKNSGLTQKLTGSAPADEADWQAGGLLRILNTGSRFGADGEGGLAQALSDFYGTETVEADKQGRAYISAWSGKKFTLSWSEQDQAYGIKLVTTDYNRSEGSSDEYVSTRLKHLSPSVSVLVGSSRIRQEDGSYAESEWEITDQNEHLISVPVGKDAAKGKQAGFGAGGEIFFPPVAVKQEDGSYEVESEWEMAYLQAEIMLRTQARPGMGRYELTVGIIDGSIKYKPTEKMLEYEDLFIRKKLEDARACEYAMSFLQPYNGFLNLSVFFASASEEEKAAYSAAFDNYMQIYRQNEAELYALKQEILAEALAKP